MNSLLCKEFQCQFLQQYYRPTWIEVDLGAIVSNVKKIKDHIGENVQLMAVVKGNACGHGILEVAETAISAGANWIGAATLDEGLVVRSRLKQVPILVFGYVSTDHLSIVSEQNITITATSLEWIRMANQVATKPFDFHLKLETGLNRLGIRSATEMEKVINIVSRNPFLNWKGAFTHFATAEEVEDLSYFQKQLNRFNEFVKMIPNRQTKIIHCANSCATLFNIFQQPFFDMVRVGRAIVGPPVEKLKNFQAFPLDTSMSLHSRLVLVKQLQAGEKVSYFGEYTTSQLQWIGTVPLGFADGWQSQFMSQTVLIDGQRMSVVGRIAMDNLMVALPKYYPVGTRVTLIGSQGEETIVGDDIEDVASQTRSQIFSGLSTRVPRMYIRNHKIETFLNPLMDQILTPT